MKSKKKRMSPKAAAKANARLTGILDTLESTGVPQSMKPEEAEDLGFPEEPAMEGCDVEAEVEDFIAVLDAGWPSATAFAQSLLTRITQALPERGSATHKHLANTVTCAFWEWRDTVRTAWRSTQSRDDSTESRSHTSKRLLESVNSQIRSLTNARARLALPQHVNAATDVEVRKAFMSGTLSTTSLGQGLNAPGIKSKDAILALDFALAGALHFLSDWATIHSKMGPKKKPGPKSEATVDLSVTIYKLALLTGLSHIEAEGLLEDISGFNGLPDLRVAGAKKRVERKA